MNTYTAAAAKVRGLFGGILNQNIYDDLLSKNSVVEIAGYLKNYTVYKEVLVDVSSNDIHRGSLEMLLKKQFVVEVNRIYLHIPKDKIAFFSDFDLDFEIEFLKTIIRGYLTEGHFFGDLSGFSFARGQEFDFPDLVKSISLDELILKLKKTKVAKYILPLLTEKDPTLIQAIETNLDLFYFNNTYKSAEKNLSAGEFAFVSDFLGTRADLYNIVLILRAKKYFNWTREQIIPHIINKYNRINSDFIYKMADSKSFSDTLELLRRTDYEKLAEEGGFDILAKKYYLSKYIRRIHKSVDFKAILYYFQLKKMDIENIITITESVRYGYPREETKKMIVYK